MHGIIERRCKTVLGRLAAVTFNMQITTSYALCGVWRAYVTGDGVV